MNLNKILGLIEVFVGVSAVAGGLPMILTPSGSDLEVTKDILANSPFSSFLIPGILLTIVIGAGNLFACYFSINNLKPSGMFGVILGPGLILWIIVQVIMIGLGSWLQPVFFLMGIAQSILGFLVYRQQKSEN